MTPDQNRSDRPANGMHIDVGHIAASGNVVFAGHNAIVRSDERRDTHHQSQHVTVGGIEASNEDFQSLRQALQAIDNTIDQVEIDEDARDAARQNAQVLKQQMTGQNKANEHLLLQATRALFEFGPAIAGAVITAFSNPLAGKIMEHAGRRALDFYKRIRVRGGSDESGVPSASVSS